MSARHATQPSPPSCYLTTTSTLSLVSVLAFALSFPATAVTGASLVSANTPEAFDKPIVVVTGAAGRTGQLAYAKLKDMDSLTVRALVYSGKTKADAQKALNCSACDASEGIYFGDVTDLTSLTVAFDGASAVLSTIGGSAENNTIDAAVDWHGVENQVAALANQSTSLPASQLKFVHISSMGTTIKNPPPFMGGADLFWKLQGEVALLSSGLGTVVVIKPCGLVDSGEGTMVTGHDDALAVAMPVSRANVAAVAAEAIVDAALPPVLRFDLCMKKGPVNAPSDVLEQARFQWQK